MKLKHLLLAAITATLSLSASAANPNATVDQVRIYINPGHGSFTGSDRPMSTIKHGSQTSTSVGSDTAGFFESNTNLQKGFGLLEKLIEYGVPFDRTKNQSTTDLSKIGAAKDLSQNIVMSHVKCGGVVDGEYNRDLTVIAAEVEANNFDMFISIHSNASTGDHNVPTHINQLLFLYRGSDGNPFVSGSDKMAKACWPHATSNKHMNYNWLSNPNQPRNTESYSDGRYDYYPSGTDANGYPYWIKGDVTFTPGWDSWTKNSYSGVSYRGSYGVMKHGVPGFLVEGYDHTYQPGLHRAMNDDVCRHEGEMYAKGINDYFGWGKTDSYGKIYGIVRDHSVVMDNPYYQVTRSNTVDANTTINQTDNKKPLNHVTVQLYNSSGTLVDSYLTDDEWNGAYMFKKVAPGNYTIKHSRIGYGDVTQSVTVTANQTNYLNIDMRAVADGTAVQGHYAYGLSLTKTDDKTYTASFKSTGALSNGKIILTNSSTKEQKVIETGTVSKGTNTVTIDATQFDEGDTYSWAVAFDNPASAGYKLIHSNSNIATSNYRVGLAIDNDETSANFGTIYTITGYGKGMQKINPDFSTDNSKFLTSYFGISSTSNSVRLETSNGKVYIANNDASSTGVWVWNPSTSTHSRVISTKAAGVAFSGTGSSRKMYISGTKYAYGYNIGTADTWSSSASSTFSSLGSLLVNGDGDIFATDNAVVASQIRYAPNNALEVPSFAISDLSGNVKFNSKWLNTEATDGSSLEGCNGGGFAFSKDKSIFAVQEGATNNTAYEAPVKIYSVIWNGSTPTFIYHYTISLSGTYAVDQMAFDHADNLYIASRQKGLLVYAIKTPARQTVTNGQGTVVGAKPPTPLYIVGNSDAVGNWDPAKAVELTNNGNNYTITLDANTTEFKISTGKAETSGDWTEFDAGNLTTNEAITNGGTINLIAQHSYNNFVLPWAGVWNITVAGDLSTLTATTSTPQPLPPLYIVGNSDAIGAWEPTNAVEFTDNHTNYTITLDANVTAFKISTNKGDWETFNNGNLTPTSTITNGNTVNLIADKNGGDIILPWEGEWNISVASDLSTLTATTTTPNPNQGPEIGPEPEDAPNPDAEPGETEEDEYAQTEGYFAYALSSSKSGNEYTFSFKSTGARKNGRIVLTNTSTGATTEIKTAIVKGQNTVKINAYDIAKGTYTWAVKMTNNANSTVTQVDSEESVVYNNGSGNARIGVAIDNDQTSANFGAIYTITGIGQGLQKFNPDMSLNGSKILTGKFGQQTGYTTRSNRLEVNQGKVYIANYASENPGVWVYDPTGSATATCVSGGAYYERAIAFYGTGSSRKAFGSHNNTQYVQRFDIGTNSTWTSGSPSAYFYQSGVLDNGDGDILVTNNAVIVSQNRYAGNNQSTNPAFAVFDHNLNLILRSDGINSTLNGSSNGGMAISPDYKTFVIADGWNETTTGYISVQVYSVSWNGSTPTFTHQYSFALSGTQQVDQMEFDHAGNLYIASRQKGLLKYAVKTSARATTTNALSSYTITGLGRDVAPSNVVATRKCKDEGNNTTAGSVDANITWTGEAGEFKVYYQTMRRDESGNRVYDNNGTWVEAGTATIASGSTSGSFTHKKLEPGDGYNRIYNYKVANYYSAVNYASEVKSKSISGKGRTVTSAAPVVPVNVKLSQPSTVVDGVTQYSLDLKLDLSLNSSVFNSTLLDDNDELVTATKYVIVVDEATAKALNAASNVKEVGRFYQGPATMTANNCNHFTIADWYMVVDFDDVTPTGDLSVATKSLTWEDVDLTMTYKPQVYTSAVRTFNFNANSAESAAYTISFPTPQWTATNTTEDASGNVTNNVEIIPVASDQISSIVGTEDMPIGSFRKVGDTENATNSVAITQANVIGVTGAIEPLPASDDVLNEWDITYTFQVQDAQGNVVYTSQQESKNNTTNANLYSNTKKVMIDVLGIPVGYDATTALDGRTRYVYNAEKNSNYKLVVKTTYSKEVDGETVEYSNESEADIVVSPTFPAPTINAGKSPGFLFLETTTHWDEDCPTDAENNYGYYKYFYDAAVDIAWDDFNDNLVRYMGFHATPKFDCAGHPDGSSTEWVPYYAASVLTDDQVSIYNTRIGTSSEYGLAGIGYPNADTDWSSLAVAEGHLPLKVHYVWAGSNPISVTGDAVFDFELSANYPIVTMATPEIKINETTVNGAYDLVLANPLSRSTSGNDLIMITTVNESYKSLVMDDIIETPTTGVEDVNVAKGTLRLYPNPANGVVTLEAWTVLEDVKIFTIDGQLVKEFETDDTRVKFNVSNLPTGVYIVHAAGATTRMIKK